MNGGWFKVSLGSILGSSWTIEQYMWAATYSNKEHKTAKMFGILIGHMLGKLTELYIIVNKKNKQQY